MSTARWRGSDGSRGDEGDETGISKEDANPAVIVGALEGRSGVVGGPVDWCLLPRNGTRNNRRADHEVRQDPTLPRKGPGVCCVTGTSVPPATGSIPAHPFSGS